MLGNSTKNIFFHCDSRSFEIVNVWEWQIWTTAKLPIAVNSADFRNAIITEIVLVHFDLLAFKVYSIWFGLTSFCLKLANYLHDYSCYLVCTIFPPMHMIHFWNQGFQGNFDCISISIILIQVVTHAMKGLWRCSEIVQKVFFFHCNSRSVHIMNV